MVDLPSDAENRDEVVILVHGTFAGDKDGNDSGKRWWQRGSGTWKWLECNLPAGTSLPQNGRLFHWNGANTQSARLSASVDLLALRHMGSASDESRASAQGHAGRSSALRAGTSGSPLK
ncbi:hypothetical protein [Streptomyces sp. NPDC050164]|uniref:hypothetical protein n=1 Tax=Streptomyces sp. NPDC050164 TaxID=3365605 RepID=UPI0037937278